MKNIPDKVVYVLKKPIEHLLNNSIQTLDEVELHAPNGKVLNLTFKLRDLIREAQMDLATKFAQMVGSSQLKEQTENAKKQETEVLEKVDYSKVNFNDPEQAYELCEKSVKEMIGSGISLEKYAEVFKRLLAEGLGTMAGIPIKELLIIKMSDYDFLNIMGLYHYCFLD